MLIGLRPGAVPKTMRSLKAHCPLSHITGITDYKRARALADRLAELPDQTADQQTFLARLNEFIEAYENYEDPPKTPGVTIRVPQTERRPHHAHPAARR